MSRLRVSRSLTVLCRDNLRDCTKCEEVVDRIIRNFHRLPLRWLGKLGKLLEIICHSRDQVIGRAQNFEQQTIEFFVKSCSPMSSEAGDMTQRNFTCHEDPSELTFISSEEFFRDFSLRTGHGVDLRGDRLGNSFDQTAESGNKIGRDDRRHSALVSNQLKKIF